jgi:hypothetical protein
VLNKFVSVIGNNARPDARNVFVSLPFPSPDDEAEEVSDDEDAITVLIIFFPGDDDDDDEDEEDARVFVDFLVASPGDDSDVTVALIADVSKVSRAVNFLWKYLKTCNHNERMNIHVTTRCSLWFPTANAKERWGQNDEKKLNKLRSSKCLSLFISFFGGWIFQPNLAFLTTER